MGIHAVVNPKMPSNKSGGGGADATHSHNKSPTNRLSNQRQHCILPPPQPHRSTATGTTDISFARGERALLHHENGNFSPTFVCNENSSRNSAILGVRLGAS
jgi:hypothetical protein